MPGRNKRILKILLTTWPFILAGLVFMSVTIAGSNPDIVEVYYSDGLYPFVAGVFSSFSRIFPFSLWDIFWVIIILLLLAGLALVVLRKIKLWWFFLSIARIISLLYAFFYLSWGYNYFRPDIGKRIGLEVRPVDEMLFRAMLDSVIDLTNENFAAVTAVDYKSIDMSVERSYSINSGILDINYPNGFRRPKSMIFSSLIAKFGISGYFGPFFNEINLNRRMLPMEYPFLLAHEKAHQFGVSSEADANLVAFVVCTTSDDPKLRYSGYLCLLLYFLEDAQYFHDYKEILEKINKPVIEELRFRQEYYYGLQVESMEKVQETMYDAYLRTNHVEHGIKDYNKVVELAISWFRYVPELSL